MRPSGGVWLCTTGALYAEAIVINALQGSPVPYEVLQLTWLIIMSLPLFVPVFRKFFDIKTVWES